MDSASTWEMENKPCKSCDGMMRYTGLPDLAGPTQFRIYKCKNCGFIKEYLEDEEKGKFMTDGYEKLNQSPPPLERLQWLMTDHS